MRRMSKNKPEITAEQAVASFRRNFSAERIRKEQKPARHANDLLGFFGKQSWGDFNYEPVGNELLEKRAKLWQDAHDRFNYMQGYSLVANEDKTTSEEVMAALAESVSGRELPMFIEMLIEYGETVKDLKNLTIQDHSNLLFAYLARDHFIDTTLNSSGKLSAFAVARYPNTFNPEKYAYSGMPFGAALNYVIEHVGSYTEDSPFPIAVAKLETVNINRLFATYNKKYPQDQLAVIPGRIFLGNESFDLITTDGFLGEFGGGAMEVTVMRMIPYEDHTRTRVSPPKWG